MDNKFKSVFWEFFRYAIVGGVSFLVDLGALVVCKECIFGRSTDFTLAICTAVGFICGLCTNYLLSMFFVFVSETQKKETKTVRGAVLYAIIGVIGLVLTELGMYLGTLVVGHTGFWYVLVKCIVAGLVLVWNYAGRKIFVYKGK